MPSGRPIIMWLKFHQEPISKYLDLFLQLFVTSIPPFIRGTKDFINKIEGQSIIPEAVFRTLDSAVY